METLEQFLAKQEADLAKFKAQQAKLDELGYIPGLTPWIVHGTALYGIQHVAFKLSNLDEFIAWAKENARDIMAVEGQYKGFYPQIPVNKDWEGATVATSGKIVVNYSTLGSEATLRVFYKDFKLTVKVPGFHNLRPRAQMSSGSPNGVVRQWMKTGDGQRQYLRPSGEWADLETLLTWEQFDAINQ